MFDDTVNWDEAELIQTSPRISWQKTHPAHKAIMTSMADEQPTYSIYKAPSMGLQISERPAAEEQEEEVGRGRKEDWDFHWLV